MSSSTFVLPALVLFEDFGNNWDEYLEAIYHYFCQDFVVSKPHVDGKRFALKRYPVIIGRRTM